MKKLNSFLRASFLLGFFSLFCTIMLFSQSISGDIAVCQGDIASYTYTPLTSGYSYIWSVTGGDITNSNSNTVEVTWANGPAGTINLTVKNASNTTIATQSLNVTIGGLPNPVIKSNFETKCSSVGAITGTPGCVMVCESRWVNYYAEPHAGSTYNWVVHGEISYTASGSNISVQWGAPGNGYVKLIETNANGCTEDEELCVIITEKPQSAFIMSPGGNTFCSGQEIKFIDQSTGSAFSDVKEWFWDFDDGTTSIEQNPTHSFAPGTYTVTLTVRNDCYCSSQTTSTITVGSYLLPEIKCSGMVCEGDTACYSTTAVCSAYNWNVTGGAIISGQNTSEICVLWLNGPYPGEISLDVPGCFGYCPTPTVTRVPGVPVTTTINGSSSICPETEHTYSVPVFPGSSYSWTVSGGVITSGQGGYKITVKWDPGTTARNISVIYNNNFAGCSGAATMNVIEKQIFTVDGDVDACPGETQLYTASGPPGSLYTWEVFDPTGNLVLPAITGLAVFPVVWNFSPGVYEVRATAIPAGIYCNNKASVFVTVHEAPVAPLITSDPGMVCPNRTYTYRATPLSSHHYIEWNVIGGTPATGGANLIDVTWDANPPYILELRQVQKTTPQCPSLQRIINVLPVVPAPLPITGNATPIANCIETYSITGPPNADKYEWSLSNTLAGSIIEDFKPAVDIQWNNTPLPVILTLKATICGSIQTSTYNILIMPMIQPVIIANASACEEEPVVFTVASQTGSSYDWEFDDGQTATTVVPAATHVFSTAGTYGIKVTVNGAGGCTASLAAGHVINIKPLPTAVITSPDELKYCANSLPLPPTTINFFAAVQTGSPYTYQWYTPGPSSTSTTHSATGSPPVGDYYVEITNTVTGCKKKSNTLSVELVACPGLCSPSGTPNFTHFPPDCGTVDFSGTVGTGSFVGWNFRDPNSPGNSSGVITQHTYSASGKYPVTLTASYSGCLNSKTKVVEIPVYADFYHEFSCGVDDQWSVKFLDLSDYVDTHILIGWEWEITDGIDTWNSLLQNPVIDLPAGNTYTVELKITGLPGEICIITKTITLPPKAVAFFTGPASVCEEINVEFMNSSLGNIISNTWTFGDGSGLLKKDAPKTYEPVSVTTTYPVSLYVTDVYGCISSFTRNITVYPNNLNGSVIPSNPAPICLGSSVTLSYLAGAGSTAPSSYAWSTTQTTASIAASNSGMYKVTVKDINGCVFTTAPVNVGVLYMPKPVIQGQKAYCLLDNILLNANYGPGYTYAWKKDGIPVPASPPFEYTEVMTGGANYEVILTEASSGCSRSSDLFAVSLFPNSFTSISPFPSSPLCAGTPISLTASGTGWFNWNTGSAFQTINVQHEGIYGVTLTTADGCKSSSEISICPTPDLSNVVPGCYTISSTESITFPGVDEFFASWTWYRDGIPVLSGTGFVPPFTTSTAGVYVLSVENACGCGASSGELVLEVEDVGPPVSNPSCATTYGGQTCATATALPASLVGVDSTTGQVTLIRSNNSNGQPASTPVCWADAATTGAADRSVWFSFVVPSAGDWTISFDNGINDYLTNTQAALYSTACTTLPIGCNDDVGNCESLAAGITANLATGTTYFLQVDVYGNDLQDVRAFAFTITKDEAASNDCITTPIDITTLYNSLGISNGFVGAEYIYNPYSYGAGNYEPGSTTVTAPNYSDATGLCNGGSVYDDVWFKFTFDGEPSTLAVYPVNGCNFYGIQVFSGTPSSPTCASVTNGLTYAGCSAPDGFVNVNCGDPATNWASGDFFDHPRVYLPASLGITDLYVRVYQITNVLEATLPTTRSEGIFSLVFEKEAGCASAQSAGEDNACCATQLNHCIGDYSGGFYNLSNAGMRGGLNLLTGSTCNPSGRIDEPSTYTVANGSTYTQHNCADEPVLSSGMVQYNNNSVYYKFTVADTITNVDISGIDTLAKVIINDSIFWDVTGISNPQVAATIALCSGFTAGVDSLVVDDPFTGSTLVINNPSTGSTLINTGTILPPTTVGDNIICPTSVTTVCGANVKLCFDNLHFSGSNGATAEFYVVPLNECGQPVSGAAMSGTLPASSCGYCLCFSPATSYLPSGDYAIVVDGENGSLVSFDLVMDIQYFIPGTAIPCDLSCTASSAITNTIKEEITSITNFKEESASNYAVPVPAKFYVDLNYVCMFSGLVNYHITDISGKKAGTGTLQAEKGENKNRINIESLESGLYILTLDMKGSQKQLKIIKE